MERRGGWLISSITGSTIANRVNKFTCRKPLAFERNTSYTIGSHFDFCNVGTNKLNVHNILT